MSIQETVPKRVGGRREGAGRKPALISQLGAAIEDADVHVEAARAILRRVRATLAGARGVYARQFAPMPDESYRSQVRRARRRVETAGVRPRRRVAA